MSDAHSNPAALELALKDAKKRKCERMMFLGDVTGYGYDVLSTLKLVRENFDEVIMGNHDAVASGVQNDKYARINPNYDIDRAQGKVLSADDLDWLRSRKYTCEEGGFIVAHGDFVNPAGWGYVIDSEDAWASFMACGKALMFCGHTHHTSVWRQEGCNLCNLFEDRFCCPAAKAESISFRLEKGARYIVNVGSVGYPRHDLCCSYAIYDSDSDRVTIRRLPFDFKEYITAMMAAKVGLPPWLLRLLRLASESMTGENDNGLAPLPAIYSELNELTPKGTEK